MWYATAKVGRVKKSIRLENRAMRKVFELASDRVDLKCKGVDGYLSFGILASKTCCTYLQLNTGKSCFDEEGWSSELVQKIAEEAKWSSVDCPAEDLWAYESAKAFLETCAQEKLSITFSW